MMVLLIDQPMLPTLPSGKVGVTKQIFFSVADVAVWTYHFVPCQVE